MLEDPALVVIRSILEFRDIVESLIEETFTPREYPDIMDSFCTILGQKPELLETVDDEMMETIQLRLEEYQLAMDLEISHLAKFDQDCIRYEVTRWLGPTTLIVSINPIPSYLHR